MKLSVPQIGFSIAAGVLVLDQAVKAVFLYGLNWIASRDGLPV